MIDLHSHVLPGIDDGPPTVEGSLDMARAAVAAGTRQLACTPHVTWDIPNTSETVLTGMAALQETLDAEGIDLRLRQGGELAITRAVELPDDELLRLHLGGGEWLLA